MANSGWIRIQPPTGVHVQVSFYSGTIKSSPVLLGNGGTNLFSAWLREESIDVDTVFFLINHSGGEVVVETRWFASDGSKLNESAITVPTYSMVMVPASVYTQ